MKEKIELSVEKEIVEENQNCKRTIEESIMYIVQKTLLAL